MILVIETALGVWLGGMALALTYKVIDNLTTKHAKRQHEKFVFRGLPEDAFSGLLPDDCWW